MCELIGLCKLYGARRCAIMNQVVKTCLFVCCDVLQILKYFHSHKKQKGVDTMLLKLYEPLLWRSLKVSVSIVTLFIYYSASDTVGFACETDILTTAATD